jgi:threonine/homoserine/homoserine lactone efflux protein
MIAAFALGILTGFLLSVPIGPINLTVIREALHGHFSRGFLIGMGGVAADTFYCAAAFLGFSSILKEAEFLWSYLQIGGGIVVFLIGLMYVMFPSRNYTPSMEKIKSATGSLHIHKAFPLGFFMGISNVGLFVLWGGVNALFVANGWIRPHSQVVSACIVGIAFGSSLWFTLVSFWVSRLHHQMKPELIAKFTRACGVMLIFFGAVLFGKVWAGK